MNQLIFGLLFFYVLWMAGNFEAVSKYCLTDIVNESYRPHKWTWEPWLVGGFFLITYAIKKMLLDNPNATTKHILMLMSVFLAYMLFITKMVYKCGESRHRNVFYVMSVGAVFVLGYDLFQNLQVR